MDKFEKFLKEKIKNEYDQIAPDRETLQRMNYHVKEACGEKKKIKWRNYTKAAAVVLALIFIAVNSHSIKAFVVNVYEKYFVQLQKNYEENISEYVKELNLNLKLENSKVDVREYVATNKGVDFKIYMEDESDIELVGCEVNLDYEKNMKQEMFVKTNGYYIASNVFEKGTWKKGKTNKITGTIKLQYIKNGNWDKLYTVDGNITLDISNLYQCREISGKQLAAIADEHFQVNNILFSTWYMKISYAEFGAGERTSMLDIKQNNKNILALCGVGDDKNKDCYFQLPDSMKEPLYITFGYIDVERPDWSIETMGESHKLDLEQCIKEDNNNEN